MFGAAERDIVAVDLVADRPTQHIAIVADDFLADSGEQFGGGRGIARV